MPTKFIKRLSGYYSDKFLFSKASIDTKARYYDHVSSILPVASHYTTRVKIQRAEGFGGFRKTLPSDVGL